MLGIALSTSPTDNDRLLQEIETWNATIGPNLAIIRASFLGDMSRVDSLIRTLDDWRALRSRILAEHASGKGEAVRLLVNDKGAASYGKAEQDVSYIVAFAQTMALTMTRKGAELRLWLTVLLVCANATAIAFALRVAFLSTRAVNAEFTERTKAEAALRDSHGKLEAMVLTRTHELATEVHAGKQRAQDLRKLERAVEQSPNMIIITNRDGIIEYVNPRFTALTGYTTEEAIGQTPRILSSGHTPATVIQSLWATVLDGHEWRAHIQDRRKDGSTFWASTVISPVRNEHDQISHFVAMHEDITQRKLAEEKALVAKEQAEVASRAKTELMANMSHELRTPLNAIIGFSEAMQIEAFGPFGHPKYAEYVNDIHASGSHLLELINDILDVSAIEAGKTDINDETLMLEPMIEAAIRLVRTRAEKGNVLIETAMSDEMPPITADPRRLKQIMVNLLSNAIKFTHPGGRVIVVTRLEADRSLTIQVRDTGIGMTPAEIEVALSMFGQVDSGLGRKHEGTGLGLPLTKGLVELHGGTLTIASTKGAGTTVTVALPPSRVVDV